MECTRYRRSSTDYVSFFILKYSVGITGEYESGYRKSRNSARNTKAAAIEIRPLLRNTKTSPNLYGLANL